MEDLWWLYEGWDAVADAYTEGVAGVRAWEKENNRRAQAGELGQSDAVDVQEKCKKLNELEGGTAGICSSASFSQTRY